MCGIIGYIGKQPATPIIMDGLKRMEYRGYDSAGLAVIVNDQRIECRKKMGKLANLQAELAKYDLPGSVGIGHTRWATHGEPNDINAHPHHDCQEEIYLNHNGIIENYYEIKAALEQQGHTFYSATDTEVLAHLIEQHHKTLNFEEAFLAALNEVIGTYGVVAISNKEPEKILAARLGSPMILGIVGDGEYIVASDVAAIMQHTRQVIYLEDREVCVLTPQGYTIKDLQAKKIDHAVNEVDWDVSQAQKQGYPHFMLKEIMEQPRVVLDCLRGRVKIEEGLAHLRGLHEYSERLQQCNRMIIVGMGTALHAAMVGEYMIEEYAELPVEIESAAEFRYRKPILDDRTVVVAVSQSGETADTIAAVREAKLKGALVLGIVNVVGSTMAREVHAGAYTHAGPEIGVASTKAFTAQLTVLALITLFLGRQRDLSLVMGQRIAKELLEMPHKMQQILDQADTIAGLAKQYGAYHDFFFIGRKYNFPMALEGALKLKEISYIHAEGYGAGDMKHGPIALIDDQFPTVAIAPQDSVYQKTVSNIQEIKARQGKVIAIVTTGDTILPKVADTVIAIPKTLEMLTPILAAVPLQLLAYHIADQLKRDIDQPRNLAKSVTVE
ncbi:MAG: glutamine--fructose-6-phosphate transaminase (isomerizing) [Candidatus Kerfeldbacteria bacterium]|nr:glutamine--fructose-6-phosphate transaminase (isomerizing) [Candidatus Kerfeldbacteria bacterium]